MLLLTITKKISHHPPSQTHAPNQQKEMASILLDVKHAQSQRHQPCNAQLLSALELFLRVARSVDHVCAKFEFPVLEHAVL